MNSAELDFGRNPLNLPIRDLSDLEFRNIFRANKSLFWCCISLFVITFAATIFTLVQTINNTGNISSLNGKMESLVQRLTLLEKKNKENELYFLDFHYEVVSLKQSLNQEINSNNNNYATTSIMIEDTKKKLTTSLMNINQTLLNEIAKNKNDQESKNEEFSNAILKNDNEHSVISSSIEKAQNNLTATLVGLNKTLKIETMKNKKDHEVFNQSLNEEMNLNNKEHDTMSIKIENLQLTQNNLSGSFANLNQTINDEIKNNQKNLVTISNIISSIKDQIELLQFPDNSFNEIDNDIELSENGRVCTSLNSSLDKWVLGKLYYCLNNTNGSVFSFEFHILKKSGSMFFGILDSSIDINYNVHQSYFWEGSFGWRDNNVVSNGVNYFKVREGEDVENDIVVLTLNLDLNSLSFENKRNGVQLSIPIPENRSWVVHCNLNNEGDKIRYANHTRLT